MHWNEAELNTHSERKQKKKKRLKTIKCEVEQRMKKYWATKKSGLIKFCNELDEMKLMCDEAQCEWRNFLLLPFFSHSPSSSSAFSSSALCVVLCRGSLWNEMYCAICIASSTIRCTLPLYSLCTRIDSGLHWGWCIVLEERKSIKCISLSLLVFRYSLAAFSLPFYSHLFLHSIHFCVSFSITMCLHWIRVHGTTL